MADLIWLGIIALVCFSIISFIYNYYKSQRQVDQMKLQDLRLVDKQKIVQNYLSWCNSMNYKPSYQHFLGWLIAELLEKMELKNEV